jgi:hypothetical protein
MSPEAAEQLIANDRSNVDVLFPFLNGEDLNSRPDQSPSRWVINFRDWPLRRGVNRPWAELEVREKESLLHSGIVTLDYPDHVAADYPDCLSIVETRVKPERDMLGRKQDPSAKGYARLWWQYGRKGIDLYVAISGLRRVLTVAATSRTLAFTFVPAQIVFSHATYVFALDRPSHLALLQSAFHDCWARKWASSMRTDLRYTPSDCFETFPFPTSLANLEDIGLRYYTHRQCIMQTTGKGLTATYNRFHDRENTARDVQQLRDLQVEMDRAVARAYGWDDLDLGHGFHETRQGERFTIAEAARNKVLDRLLKLNQERHAAEVSAGLFDENKPKIQRGRKRKEPPANGVLF